MMLQIQRTVYKQQLPKRALYGQAPDQFSKDLLQAIEHRQE
jgi:hypothetical protein